MGVIRALDIGIVGAGFAGTAAALFLTRAGHRVTLYEEAESPAAVGAGILIQPTGLRVLGELGLLAAALARGSRIERLACRTAEGRSVLDLWYEHFEPGWFGLGMHRGGLFELLLDAVRAEGIALHAGVSVRALERSGERVHPTDQEGASLGEHELVVVADGARSDLRDARHTKYVRPYPWGALWFVAEDRERAFGGRLHQIADSTTALLGFLPSGTGPSTGSGNQLVSLFWSLRTRELGSAPRSLDDWKRAVRRLEPRAEALLSQIEEPGQLLPASYLDVVMRRWHGERVVFIGDAAHAMSPQLGQGTNLALEDARVLGECLTEPFSLASGLEGFTRQRRRHLRYYQFASRALTPFFQSRWRSLGALRDHTMDALCRFPPTRQLMLATLAGVSLGLLGPTLPLEPIRARLAQ